MPKAASNPLERTSVQAMLVLVGVAVLANSAVDRTDDGLPWEATLTGFCVFAIVFSAIVARKTEVALSILRFPRLLPHPPPAATSPTRYPLCDGHRVRIRHGAAAWC